MKINLNKKLLGIILYIIPLMALTGMTSQAAQISAGESPSIENVANKYYQGIDEESAALETMSLSAAISDLEDDAIIIEMYSATPTTYITFNSETQTIITYSSSTEAPKSIEIPAQIGGYDVLHIASRAFAGFQLTEVTFEEGSKLETIGTYAFYNNQNLKGEVIIPYTVTSIGDYAFMWTNLYALYIGPDTTYTSGSRLGIIQDYINETISTTNKNMSYNETALIIDNNYIYDSVNAVLIDPETDTLIRHYPEHIDNATSVTVPDGIVHIAEQAYYQDTHITEVLFPSTLETIGDYTFQGIAIEELNFNDTRIKTIGEGAFYGCSELLKLDFSKNTLTHIEKSAFYQCKSITLVKASKSLEYLGENVFYECTSLEDVVDLENTVIGEIGASAFYKCSVLEELNLPESLHTIGKAVFQATPITILELPKLVEIIPEDMVKACTSLLEIIWYGELKEIGKEAFGGTTSMTTLTSSKYDNPFESVTHVGTAIFVTNGSSTTSSNKTASAYCLPIVLPNIETIDNLAFTESKITQLDITSQKITELPNYMCYKTRAMSVVTIPESITTMGSYIFAGVSGSTMTLKSINLAKENGEIIEGYNGVPEGVTSLPTYMFAYNYTIEEFNFHDGITELGSGMFYNCTRMYNFYLGKNVQSIGSSCFFTGNSSTNVYIDQYTDDISGAPWGNTKNWIIWNGLTIADRLSDSGEIVYQYLLKLHDESQDDTATVINIRNAAESDYYAGYFAHEVWDRNDRTQKYYVTHIEDSTFISNGSMQSVFMEEGITHIGEYCFYNASTITSTIVLPDGLEEVGNYAFAGISKTTVQSASLRVTIGEGLKVLSNSMFSSSTRLLEVNLPHSIIYVEENAFSGSLPSVTSLTFSNRVEFEEGASGLLPSGLKTLYLTGYTSDETIPGYDEIGISNYSVNVYYKDTYEYETENGVILFHSETSTVSKYIGSDTVVNIPEYIEIDGVEHPVLYIEDYFMTASNKTVTEVNVPSTVTDMGENAFYQNNNYIELIYIDKIEDSIENAPWGNTGNNLLVLWNNSKRINDYIYKIREDGYINIVRYLGTEPYQDLTQFNEWFEVNPEYVILEIYENAFYGNTYVETIILPDSVDYIGDYAFSYCTNLEFINWPATMSEYGMGDHIVSYASSLKEIHIPDGVVDTGEYLGYYCSSLELVTVPRSVTTIGTMFLLGGVTNWVGPYRNPYMIVQFLDRLETEQVGSESWTSYKSGNTTYRYAGIILYEDRILQDKWVYSVSTQTVMTYVDYDYEDEYVEFPTSFIDRDGNVSYPNTIFTSVTGTGSANTVRYLYNSLHYADTIVIPDGYETIATKAFQSVEATTIDIADSVNSIGSYCFNKAYNLTDISLPEGITLIDTFTFDQCTSLKEIIIPTTVTSIGVYAFQNCSSLEKVELPYGLISIGNSAFSYCTSLESFHMPDTVTTLGWNVFRDSTSLKDINLSKNIKALNGSTFYNTAIEVISFGDALTTMGSNEFSGCENLVTVNVGEYDSKITSFNSNNMDTFANTPALEYINIGQARDSVTSTVSSNAPWGAEDSTVVRYLGEYIQFEYYIEQVFPVYGEIKFYLYIWAENEKNYISEIHFPSQSEGLDPEYVGDYVWHDEDNPYIYEINDYGVYTFTGYDSNTTQATHIQIFVESFEFPIIEAQNVEITPYQVSIFTEEDLLNKAEAKACTYEGLSLDVNIWEDEFDNIYDLKEYGDETIITVYAYDDRYGTYTKTEITVTLVESRTPFIFANDYELNIIELFDIKYDTELVEDDDEIKSSLKTIEDYIITYTEAYAFNFDDTRELSVYIDDEYLKAAHKELFENGTYDVTLYTYDDIEDEFEYVTVTLSYNESIWLPRVEAQDAEMNLSQAKVMTTDWFIELSEAQGFTYDDIELEVLLSDEDLLNIQNLTEVGETTQVTLKVVDLRYLTFAQKTVTVTIVEPRIPIIEASDVELEQKWFNILETVYGEIQELLTLEYTSDSTEVQLCFSILRNMVIDLTKAKAWNYNKSTVLDVDVTDEEILALYEALKDATSYEDSSYEITLTTYDSVEMAGNNTTAIIWYDKDKWNPLIDATDVELTHLELQALQDITDEDAMKNHMIDITKAAATNYDSSQSLEVIVDNVNVLELYAQLVSKGTYTVNFSTYDEEQGTSATTSARITYNASIWTPTITAIDVTLNEYQASVITESELLVLAEAKGFTYEGTIIEKVYLVDGHIELVNALREKGSSVTVSAYVVDERYGTTAYTTFKVSIVDPLYPLITAQSVELTFEEMDALKELTNLEDIKTFIIEATKAMATNHDETRSLDVEIDENYLTNLYQELMDKDKYVVTFTTYDPEEMTSASVSVTITREVAKDPLIEAYDVTLTLEQFLSLEACETDAEIITLIIQYTQAKATNYDGSKDLEVLVDSQYTQAIVSALITGGSYTVEFTTYDEEQDTSARTTATITYVIEAMGPSITAIDVELNPYQAEVITASKLLVLAEAKGLTFDEISLTVNLKAGEISKVNGLTQVGESVEVEAFVTDTRYDLSAYTNIKVTIIDALYPKITAEDVVLETVYYKILEELNKDLEENPDDVESLKTTIIYIYNMVVDITEAEAWNHDKSTELEVEISEQQLLDIYTQLTQYGFVEITYDTYDPVEMTSATTTATIYYLWDPIIEASDVVIDFDELQNFRLSDTNTAVEVEAYVIELVEAWAVGYYTYQEYGDPTKVEGFDASLHLEVTLSDFVGNTAYDTLYNNGELEVTLTTTDPEFNTTATTTATITYGGGEPELVPEPEPESDQNQNRNRNRTQNRNQNKNRNQNRNQNRNHWNQNQNRNQNRNQNQSRNQNQK